MSETKERFERLSGGRICEGYGLSEAPVVTHCNPLRGTNKIGSIGMPMPDVDCRIVDPDGGIDDVAPGTAGELILRGPQLMREYHNNPRRDGRALRRLDDDKLWLFTGDIARDGRRRLLLYRGPQEGRDQGGRASRFGHAMWKRSCVAHPAVLGSRVWRVCRILVRGEIVKAWIVLRPELDASGDELRDLVSGPAAFLQDSGAIRIPLSTAEVQRGKSFASRIGPARLQRAASRILRARAVVRKSKRGPEQSGPLPLIHAARSDF